MMKINKKCNINITFSDQYSPILNDLINYIPILKRALTDAKNNIITTNDNTTNIHTQTVRERIYYIRNSLQKTKKLGCYSCCVVDQPLSMKQRPSLTRCADELIETHFYCEKCVHV